MESKKKYLCFMFLLSTGKVLRNFKFEIRFFFFEVGILTILLQKIGNHNARYMKVVRKTSITLERLKIFQRNLKE